MSCACVLVWLLHLFCECRQPDTKATYHTVAIFPAYHIMYISKYVSNVCICSMEHATVNILSFYDGKWK